MKNSPKIKTSNLLHLAMLNVCSLNNKPMFIKDYVVGESYRLLDCLELTKTWINSNKSL